MRVTLEGVSVTIGTAKLIDDVHLDVASGAMVAIVGPNGSGKSTLLRTIYRRAVPSAGVVRVDGDDVRGLHPRQVARRVGVVAQETPSDFDLDVRDVVLMGRTPHKSTLERESVDDHRRVRDALERVGAWHLADRSFTTLSGGEKQRVLLARALTQGTPVLLLDEPTNHLDIAYQLDLLALVRSLGVTVVTALHDLNLAAGFCDTVAVLDRGRLVATGPPADVITPALVGQVFGVPVSRLTHPATGGLLLAFGGAPTPPPDLHRSHLATDHTTARGIHP